MSVNTFSKGIVGILVELFVIYFNQRIFVTMSIVIYLVNPSSIDSSLRTTMRYLPSEPNVLQNVTNLQCTEIRSGKKKKKKKKRGTGETHT